MLTKPNSFWKGFVKALLFISILSILLNVFLYSQLRKYYALLYAMKLDPLGLSAFHGAVHSNPDKNLPTVVLYGDSRAAQWPAPALDGLTFLNRAIGNQTTAQVLLRFDEHVGPLRPDIIVLQVGINDLKTIPLFPGGEQDIIANCKLNIEQIVEKSLRLDSVVVISTIFPTGNVPLARTLVWSDEIDKAIVEVNAYIQSLASDQVIVFDAAALLSNAKGKMKPEYSHDELHLNESGYAVLNAALVKLLEESK